MAQTYSQFLQENPDMVAQAQGQMQSAPPPMQPQAAPPPAQATPAAAPAQAAPQAPQAQVAPVQGGGGFGEAAQAAMPMIQQAGQGESGNKSMKDQSTVQDVMSIFKMFGGGG